jgi:hypothetical protein
MEDLMKNLLKQSTMMVVVVMILTLVGCATGGGSNAFYKAQMDWAAIQANQKPKALFELKAVSGKAIENLETIAVYDPRTSQQKDLQQYIEQAHPGWALARSVVDTTGKVLGIYFVKEGVSDIFSSITKIATVPTTSISQSISGTGNTASLRNMGDMSTGAIGDGSLVGGLVDQTSAPTVVNPVIVEQPAPIVVDPVVVDPVIIP